MSPDEVFGVIVRAVGLIVSVAAVGVVFPGMLALVGGGPGAGLVFYGFPLLVLGLWLLRGGRAAVAFAYPQRRCSAREAALLRDYCRPAPDKREQSDDD